MKSMIQKLVTSLFVLLLVLVLPGCGGGDESGIDSNVDVSALTAELDSSDDAVVIDALANLWQAEDKMLPTLPKLIELLKHNNAEVRRLASYNIFVLGEDAKDAIEPIKALLKTEKDPGARSQHANTWNSIDPDNATPLGQN